MKIAIIGSGFFGSTIAIQLSKNKEYSITLYERENKILQNASKKKPNEVSSWISLSKISKNS